MRTSSRWTTYTGDPGHGGQWFGYNAIDKDTNDASEWEYTDGLETDFTDWNSGDPNDNSARCGMFVY